MGLPKQLRRAAAAQRNAVVLANPGAALGLSLAGGVNLTGALGAGGVPAAGFGAGTPLAGLPPFASVFNSPTLYDAGLSSPTPWSELGRLTAQGRTTFGQPPGYGAPMPSFNFGTFLGSSGGLQAVTQPTSGGTSFGDILSQGLQVLGQYEMSKQARKDARRAYLRAMNLAKLGIGPGVLNQAGVAGNPLLSQNPNLGGAGQTSTGQFAQQNAVPQWYQQGFLGLNPADSGTAAAAAGAGVGGTIGAEVGGPLGAVVGAAGGAAAGALGNMAMNALTGAPSGGSRVRAPRIVGAIDNNTGRSYFYRYVGAPILFRGDLSTLKTVKKAVGKFGGLARSTGHFRLARRAGR